MKHEHTEESPHSMVSPMAQQSRMPQSSNVLASTDSTSRASTPSASQSQQTRPSPAAKQTKNKASAPVMNSSNLPAGTLLGTHNFISWKARTNAALQAFGLPTTDSGKPTSITPKQWTALSELSARTIQNFVPASILQKVQSSHYYNHATLVADLESLTLRFRFMDLPPEVRVRTYAFLMSEDTFISYLPLQKEVTGYPPIATTCRQIWKESKAHVYKRCTFALNITAPNEVPSEEQLALERSTDVHLISRQWAKKLDSAYKKDLSQLIVSVHVRDEGDDSSSVLFLLGFGYTRGRGLELNICHNSEGKALSQASQRLVDDYTAEMEQRRQMLGIEGQSLLMAVTTEDQIWKYGTLKYSRDTV